MNTFLILSAGILIGHLVGLYVLISALQGTRMK